MYNEAVYEDVPVGTDLYQEEYRPSDIRFSPTANVILLVMWLVLCGLGFIIIFLAKQPALGAAIIAVPTFIGMVIKPTFGLCMMMLVLPTGGGVGYEEIFSLDRGVGIAFAVAFFVNILFTRPSLNMRPKFLWIYVAYTVWVILATLAAPYLQYEWVRGFTQIQLLAFVLIVYWVLETNDRRTYVWALRSYLVGTLAMIAITYITGAAIVSMEEEGGGRYAATLGKAINANALAVIVGLAFLAAIYLMVTDRKIFWRLVYLVGIVLLPIMLIRIGSRGAIVAIVFTFGSPLLFARQVLRKPVLAMTLFVAMIMVCTLAVLIVGRTGIEEKVAGRLTDIQYAKQSAAYRFSLMQTAVDMSVKYPVGTSHFAWQERSGLYNFPHSDFFYCLGIYGMLGGVFFLVMMILMMLGIKRMPLNVEKLYSRAILTFLLITGLNVTQVYRKHFWVFAALILAGETFAKRREAEKYASITEEDLPADPRSFDTSQTAGL